MWRMYVAYSILAGARAADVAPTPTAPDLTGWLQTGGFAGLAAALLLFAKTAYKRETDRADRLEGQIREQEAFFRNEVVPAMRDSADALREATQVLRQREGRRRDRDD
jgi:membrane protein implicated in regulation of membrane protease activity